jgi:hypothetical protein
MPPMETNGWFPRSTRNRLAILMSILSLGLLAAWNFETGYALNDQKMFEPKGCFFHEWPFVTRDIATSIFTATDPTIDSFCVTFLMLPLLLLMNLLLIPGWRLWQPAVTLRWIAALLMLFGFAVIVKDRSTDEESLFYFYSTHFRLIAANYLTTAFAFLLFKNESTPHPDHGISST